MSPNKIPAGTPCRVIDDQGRDVGTCLFLGLDISDAQWCFKILMNEKVEELIVGWWTLIPLLFSEDVSS